MGASEIIARYGLSSFTADHVERDVDEARLWMIHAAESESDAVRCDTLGFIESAAQYRENRDFCMSLAYINGHAVRETIARTLAAEMSSARPDESAETWSFYEPSCGDETCLDCDRPMWHHIVHDTREILCPFGRRYWRIVRAILPRVMGKDRSDDVVLLWALARRP